MNESRIAKTQKNAVTAIAQNFLSIILSFLARIIFVRILSVDYLGINGLFSNVLNVLSLADLGMQTAMMYSLYKPIAEDDKDKIKNLVAFFKKIYMVIAIVVFIVGIAVIPFLKFIINLDRDIPNLIAYYILSLLNVVISYLFIYRTTLIVADQKSFILNKYIMIFRIISFGAQIIVLILFKNYFLYLAVAVIVGFLSNLYQNHIALKLYPFLKEKASKLEKSDINRIVVDIKALFIYRISGTIQSNTDNILISIFVGTVFVGYYSNYIMVITSLISVITLIFNSVKASIGSIIASDDTTLEHKEFYFWVLELLDFWMVAFCSICCICLFSDFVELFFGKEYVLSLPIVIAIVLIFYTNNIRQTIWTFRETTGLFHETQYITTVTAILNIVFSLIGGHYWGMLGILIATVLSRMLYAWWKEPIILFNSYFRKSSKHYYVVYVCRFLLFGLTCITTYILGMVLKSDNLLVTFVWKIIICCIVPNLIFFFYFKNSKEFKYLWVKLVEPLRRKAFKIL